MPQPLFLVRCSQRMKRGRNQSSFSVLGVALVLGILVLQCEAAPAPAKPPAAAKPSVTAAAVAPQQHQGSADPPSSNRPESSQSQVLEGGLSIDSIAAEAAARPAAQLPSQYAVKGVIDPQSPLFSEEPGVLVPLAQGRSPVGDWLAAVEAAGPSTPLSDPMLVGTVFIPHNEAFEGLYPELRLLKLAGRPVGEYFSNASTANLALQLNCLTVPGAALKIDEMWPGRLLRTAGYGAIKVVSNGADKPARLQHQPSGVFFSIVEPDLQSGSAVAHVIDVLPPAAVLSRVAASPADEQDLQYRSVLSALTDPARDLQAFNLMVQRAALSGLMDSNSDAFTLFAPDEKAVAALMASLPMSTRQQLLTNLTLADAFVSSHLVLGTALGRKALEALGPAGQLKTPQGNLVIGFAAEHHQSVQQQQQQPEGVALVETGRTVVTEAGRTEVDDSSTLLPQPAAEAETEEAAAAAAAAAAGSSRAPGEGAGAPLGATSVAEEPPRPTPSFIVGVDVSESEPAAAAAAEGAAGTPKPAATRDRALTVADASLVLSDVVGGKAVLHVVDRVLISPALSRELGLPANPGYVELEALPPPAGTSAGGRARLSTTVFVLPAAVGVLLLALL